VKAIIQQRALELGFEACRFTTAEPPQSAVHFQRWLGAGCHGEMAYLERNAAKRVEPQRVLPEAQSIITLAASYFRSGQVPADCLHDTAPAPGKGPSQARAETLVPSPPAGTIARYAQYADYHHVLGERLKLLSQFVNGLGGSNTSSLWYVDTGPLLERDLAQRSGLGFVGKHTNLISRGLGNWFFLCEIITTLKLEPDAPERNRCGTCARCIAACPTQAITAPFQLDARRCLSYLTIELKGPIPVEFRPALGTRIYGCDDCLAVCPWNRFARDGRLMREHFRNDFDSPNLLDLLALDDPAFKRRFAGTPLLRTKRRGLLRNVCVALGNLGDPTALPALRQAALDPEPLIAEHAKWAVERIEANAQNEPPPPDLRALA
jgi:epoxyqueuosine reductase